MAKIAIRSERASMPVARRTLARGEGWSISDVVCGLGPKDRPFEERHSSVAIAIVIGGTFHYRSRAGRDLMTPGSLMLGSAGQSFECSHEHGTGDRCLSFSYSPEFWDRIGAKSVFPALRVPPIRALSPVIARCCSALNGPGPMPWEELALELVSETARVAGSISESEAASPSAMAKVAKTIRKVESDPAEPYDLSGLAREAQLSPFHFLRVFQSVTGVTPHQYLLRLRMQRAALRLRIERAKVVDIALDCGFGDVSNFNRMFRAELGVSPREWRRRA